MHCIDIVSRFVVVQIAETAKMRNNIEGFGDCWIYKFLCPESVQGDKAFYECDLK